MANAPRRKFGQSQKERIFFACLPDDAAVAHIAALAQELKRTNNLVGTPILPQHLHVTLFHLGDWQAFPQEIVDIAKQAASGLRAPAFEATFSRAESFRTSTGIYPFVFTCGKAAGAWRPFHAALGEALKRVGLEGATKGQFQPHITLLRDRLRIPPLAIEPVRWAVKEFVLIHSLLGKTTHIHLGRWPLDDVPSQTALF